MVVAILIGAAFFYDSWRVSSILSVYGLLAVARIIYQIILSYFEKSRNKKTAELTSHPPATVIIATYNEPPETFYPGLESIMNQKYSNLEVVVVDDGSNNSLEIGAIAGHLGAKYIRIPHGGKRMALKAGFDNLSPDTKYVLTADSDTTWMPDAAEKMIKMLEAKPDLGAVTGYVAVRNADTNPLTKLISLRYWMAFNHERAAQGFYNSVNCVSGPLGAYRRDLIDVIKEPFINQTFRGEDCTFGDDRHLTNLCLLRGYGVGYSEAVCYTDAPTKLREFIRQQSRWSKSYWREILWQMKSLNRHSGYLTYELIFALVMPLILIVSIYYGLAQVLITGNATTLYLYLLTVSVMSLARVVDPIIRTRNFRFLAFVVYSYFYFLVLLPVKIYALFNISDRSWGTRSANQVM